MAFVIDRANAGGGAGVADCGGCQAERLIAFINVVISHRDTNEKLAAHRNRSRRGVSSPGGAVEIFERAANVGTERGFGVQCCESNRLAQGERDQNSWRSGDSKDSFLRPFIDEDTVNRDGVFCTLNSDRQNGQVCQPARTGAVHDCVIEGLRQGVAWS